MACLASNFIMTDSNSSPKAKLSKTEFGIAGATSGALTRFLCQPLDVIKIRFQLQVEPLKATCKEAKYWSVSQAARSIIKDEGVKALWKGHVPAQALSIIYGLVQFSSFEMLTQKAWQLSHRLQEDSVKPVVHFVCGSIAGCLATLASFPPDVIRTRLIAQGEPKAEVNLLKTGQHLISGISYNPAYFATRVVRQLVEIYKNMFQLVAALYTREGPRAFYKGLSPTLLQIAPHAGAQFAFYNIFKTLWLSAVGDSQQNAASQLSAVGSFACGSASGVAAKILVYPFDVAKKRLQIQGFNHARKGFGKAFTCQGLLNCFWLTLIHEQYLGLFKGLWPSLLKAGITTGFHFGIYEQTCYILAALHR